MSKNSRMELLQVPYYQLLKLELPSYINSVIDIAERFDPEMLKIECTFDLLVAEKPQLDKLDVKFGAHPMTKLMRELREMRTVYLGSISSRLNVVEKENKVDPDNKVNLVKVEVKRFLKNFNSSRTEIVKREKLTRFFTSIDQNEELEEALSLLKFTEHLNNLRNVHSSILELAKKIVTSRSKRPNEKTTDLKKTVILATQDFFKELEIAQLRNKDLDYVLLFNELNDLAVQYINMVSRRVLFNKQKAESKKGSHTEETQVTTETTNSSPDVQPLAQRMFHLDAEELNKNGNENGNVNDFGVNSSEKEKAVAKSAKQAQLPPLNNED